MERERGFFEIGVYHPKTEHNIGTLWRSAYQLGASGIFTIGKRYKKQHSDTYKTPRHIPLRHFKTMDNFLAQRPHGVRLVAAEMPGVPISSFSHPLQAIYLLGAEDHGLPPDVIEKCDCIVALEAVCMPSYNVAVAGSIVMYNRVFGG